MADPVIVRIESASPSIGTDPVLKILVQSWRLILTSVVLGAAIAVALSLVMTPMYRASVLAAPSEAGGLQSALGGLGGGLGGIASLAGLAVSGGPTVETARALLESRSVLRKVIHQHDLLPVLFPDRWDTDKSDWSVDDPADVPTLDDGADRFLESNLSVEFDAVTGQTTVSVELPDPVTAAAVANDIVAQVNRSMRDKTVADADAIIALLERELTKSGIVEIRQSLAKLIEEQIKYSAVARAREDFAFTVLDPAVVPNSKDVYWPNPVLMGVFGSVVGFLGGFAVAVALLIWRGSGRRGARD
jgi:uncharacterized protein involved in exopolysaccharide biosynthesis